MDNIVGLSAAIFVAMTASPLSQSLLAAPTVSDVFSLLGGVLMLIGSLQLLRDSAAK